MRKGRSLHIFKKMWICIIAVIVVMTALTACLNEDSSEDSSGELQGTKFDSNISMVQNGYPVLIPDITYQEAYDYFFGNPQWRGFKADDGSDVVEFSGECTYGDEDATVYIQFVIDDEESFSMWYASLLVGDEKITADEQMFIEFVYTPFATYSEEVLGEVLSQDIQDAFVEIYDSLEYTADDDYEYGGTQDYYYGEDEEDDEWQDWSYDDTYDDYDYDYNTYDYDDYDYDDYEELSDSDEEEYIFPHSDTKKLTVKQVKKLSKSDRRLAKNEIYARHGRRFLDQYLQEYFDEKSWYFGIIEPDDFDESVFNKVEKYNIRLLVKYE